MRGGSHSSYQPDPARQEAARALMAEHRELDTAELAKFIDPDLIAYIDDYQIGVLDLRECEIPADVDENVADCLRNNTTIYSEEVEDILDQDATLQRTLKLPSGEARSAAVRARRSIVVLSLLALQSATDPTEPGAQTARGVA